MQLAARMYASGYVNPGKQIIKNLFKVMKLTIIILLAACLTASATGFGQQVTLHQKSITLQKLFKEIRKQTGYVFFYDAKLISGARAISIDVTNVSVSEALRVSLKDQQLDFSIENKTITITRSSASPKAEATNVETAGLIDISGKVTNEDGTPLQGATVKVRGGNNITSTNTEGIFLLKGVDSHATLEVSFVGYESMAVPVKERTSITIALKLNVVTNAEVIVRKGYYDEKKALSTGNVSTVTAKEIERQPVNNVLLAMQGRVAGAEIIQYTGLPGSAVRIKIRGQNSIINGNAPLFIVDGVPFPADNMVGSSELFGVNYNSGGNPLSYINPNDIESIDVLKDADATAIYGSRGANGVILITTKRGKPGSTQVTVNAQSGFGKVAHKMKLLNTRQYLDMRYEAFKNDGAIPNPTVDFDLTLWDTTRYTDWQKELIGGTARYNDIQATTSGGTLNTQFLIGTAYHKETSVFPTDANDQKVSVNFNINNTSPNKKFKISLSGNYLVDENQLHSDLTSLAFLLPPIAPMMYNPDGSNNWEPNLAGGSTWGNFLTNPAARLTIKYTYKTNNLIGNSIASYQIFPGLQISSSLGYNNIQSRGVLAVPLVSYDPATWQSVQRRSSFSNGISTSWIFEPQLTYSRKIAKGEVKALIGGTFQNNRTYGEGFEAAGFNSDLLLQNIQSATTILPSSFYSLYKYNAIFGRVNYNWDSRYTINLTGRRDGTSRFSPERRYHNFGAIGAGWIFSKEKFVKVSFLSFGKLRGSYGTTGNDQVGNYSYMDLYSPVPVSSPYMGVNGIRPDRIYTPDLAWEETRKAELGLDLGFINDRILLSISLYQNRSGNQLMDYFLTSVTGFSSIKKNLNGNVENRGLEIEIKSQNIIKNNFAWSSAFNASSSRNKLISLSGDVDPYFIRRIGSSLSSYDAFKFLGVDPITGLYQFADRNGNTTLNPNSATDLQKFDPTPKFYGGLQNTFTYKGWQLDFNLQFVYGNKIPFSWNSIPGKSFNQPTIMLARWQSPGQVSTIQRFSQNTSVNNAYINFKDSDGLWDDGSYIRLRNLSLYWTFPKSWQQKIKLKNARIFLQGQNLFVITKFKGVDPETNGITMLPLLRVITTGVQLNF